MLSVIASISACLAMMNWLCLCAESSPQNELKSKNFSLGVVWNGNVTQKIPMVQHTFEELRPRNTTASPPGAHKGGICGVPVGSMEPIAAAPINQATLTAAKSVVISASRSSRGHPHRIVFIVSVSFQSNKSTGENGTIDK